MNRHVVSLELAKQLKEAGWTKETEFFYSIYSDNEHRLIYSKSEEANWDENRSQYPAPLATEILEELPNNVKEYEFYILKDERGYLVGYCLDEEYGEHRVLGEMEDKTKNEIPFIDESLPNALAKMYLYLKKEGLL